MPSKHHHHTTSSSSSFPSCIRPSATEDDRDIPPPPPPPSQASSKSNLTTCLYQTHLGPFSITWSRTFLGHSVHLNLHSSSPSSSPFSPRSTLSFSSLRFHLHLKPFLFWKRHGHKKLASNISADVHVYWDLSRAKFGSGPEPESGFYVAVVVDGEMVLLVGDSVKEAYSRAKAHKPERNQVLLLRREHVFGNKVYTTKARFGGKNREISIDCRLNEDAKLYFSVENKRVLQIKRLKWKFRGNEKIEVDGVPIQISWDVHNWLFERNLEDRHAIFMFRIGSPGLEKQEQDNQDQVEVSSQFHEKNGIVSSQSNSWSFGLNSIEWKKMRRSLLRTARSSSSSSISMSSASSGCSSSVMEWSSAEENELSSSSGFSLLVYAWRK